MVKPKSPDLPLFEIVPEKPTPKTDCALNGCFDKFWKHYPRHVAKEAARKAYRKIPHLQHQTVLEKLIQYPFSSVKDWMPHASTWLNGKRWEDNPQHLKQNKIGPRQVSDFSNGEF